MYKRKERGIQGGEGGRGKWDIESKRELNRIIKKEGKKELVVIYKSNFSQQLRIPVLRNMHILYREED